jgi:hypothetical protein
MRLAAHRLLLLCSALACAASLAFAQTPKAGHGAAVSPPANEALRQELLRMYEADQAARAPMQTGKLMTEAEVRRENEVDAANTRRLTEIFKQYGFPSVALVGKDGAHAAFIMVIHGDSLALKKRSLPYIEKAAQRGEVPAEAFASLTDTILNAEGKPQLYGTKFDLVGGRWTLAPTKDPARLDARRAELGLPPIAVYARGFAELYKMPLDESSLPPAPPRK